MLLTELFSSSLSGRAHQPGLEYTDAAGTLHALTFGDVDARANRMANELAARGLVRGDRLCVHLTNRIEFIDLFLACTKLGVIFVPANVLYKERELRHIIGDSAPSAVVAGRDAESMYPADVPVWFAEDLADAASSCAATAPVAALNGTDAALIVYTSGTTGAAKGAVLSHDALSANANTITDAWRITDADRYLAVLPLFHVHGLGNGVHA